MDLTPIFATFIVFGSVVTVIYLFIRKNERKLMIDKGADPSIFNIERSSPSALKYGLFLIGIGVGILVGSIIDASTYLGEEVSYFSMISLFGGLSLVISYFVGKKHQ